VGKAINGDRLLFLFGLLMLVIGGLMLRTKRSMSVPKRIKVADLG
jgi:hypothetical protein